MEKSIISSHRDIPCECESISFLSHNRAVLINGLSDLQKNGGYDSIGLATMRHDGKGYLVRKQAQFANLETEKVPLHHFNILFLPRNDKQAITKFAVDQGDSKNDSSLEFVRTKSQLSHQGHSMGIAHTRWATQGAKTDCNAHPHTDASGRIAVVHNGDIYNSNVLRTWLEAKGCAFYGETDSELIAKLIGVYYSENDNKNKTKCGLKQAVEKAMSHCEGTWVCICSSLSFDMLVQRVVLT